MDEKNPRILVVGARERYTQFFDGLEAAVNYQFDFAADPGAVHTYLYRHAPGAVLLELPPGPQGGEQALAWLATLKNHAAVVVVCCRDDIDFYLTVMEHGAFDYVTCDTPYSEIARVLANALRWRARQQRLEAGSSHLDPVGSQSRERK